MNKAVAWQNTLACLPVCGGGLLLKHLPNVEMRFYCPQAFLSLDSYCGMDVFVKTQAFWD